MHVHAVIQFLQLPVRRFAINQAIAFLKKEPGPIPLIETPGAGSLFREWSSDMAKSASARFQASS